MSIEHLEGPTPSPSYKGFSGQPPEPPPPPPRDRRPIVIAGVAAAAVMAIGLGIWAAPREVGAPEVQPMQPAAAEPQVQIAMNPVPPPAEVAAGTPMEVLPPDMAAPPPRAMSVTAPQPVATPAPAPPPAASPPVARAPATPRGPSAPNSTLARLETPPAARSSADQPAFDCGGALSAAQAMVCSDARLSAKDRRLARAYRQALRAGVPGGSLAAEQEDWRAIREDAAEVSPRAVAQLYDQRIRELEDMSDWAREERGDWAREEE